ncbi:protein-methionine-sulfoxide reductase heme-binding subunit MsrQ [Salinimonas chungwhensis]|uniref:sulfite oxidase heme-binding subunit YedZ n=1 Tax=Salinimonas chungwhensis TaxID=265425 RepID=UPI00037BB548|nr:protein-methionine-sulfoxide reductase heme-binding subunit MsrQ [Salinimonas chungwhensis]
MAFRLFKKPARLTKAQLLTGKSMVHILVLGALVWQFVMGFTDNLGADPVQALLNFTGLHAIHILLLTLCLSPLAQLTPCGDFIRYRRMLGVYTFIYALAHFATYILFELQLDWPLIGSELIERPYISVGFVALLLLLAMAVTSFDRLRKKMGRRWQSLHNTVYLAILLALLHYSWSQKTVLADPLLYWFAAFVILLPRMKRWYQSLQRKSDGKKKHKTTATRTT